MEVGIEDCLHIEFEYNRSKYHLKDAVLGKIFFLLVRIKIKHMEIAIIKREVMASTPTTHAACTRPPEACTRGLQPAELPDAHVAVDGDGRQHL